MFTGIIKSVGEVKDIIKDDEILKIKISSSENIFNSTQIGDSVSVNGTCLTAVEKNIQNHIISFDVVGETISKTNLDYLQNNEKVNLETPLKIIDGLVIRCPTFLIKSRLLPCNFNPLPSLEI